MATTTNRCESCVRNVILVAGYDYVNHSRTFFQTIALERIRDLVRREEHMRYPLRFHLFSAGTGIAAESVVLDSTYSLKEAGDPGGLTIGRFWQRVEIRRAPVEKAYYQEGVFRRPAERQAPPKGKNPIPPVMSMASIYRYLYLFWETREAARARVPADVPVDESILELSLFCHAAGPSVMLVNSAPGRRGAGSRDPADKDGRAADFTGFGLEPGQERDPTIEEGVAPKVFWGRIADVFDREAGRVWLWGSAQTPEALFYHRLIRATLSTPAIKLLLDHARSQKPPEIPDHTKIRVSDLLLAEGLMGRGIGRTSKPLTFGHVRALIADAVDGSFATAVARKLGVTTYAVPLGAAAAVQPDGLMSVSETFNDIIDFHEVLTQLRVDRARRYGVLGNAPPASPPRARNATSPLAGLRLFPVYKREGYDDVFRRDETLQGALDAAFNRVGRPSGGSPVNAVAMSIAEITSVVDIASLATSGKAGDIASGARIPERGIFPYAGVRDEDMYYSASVLKVAAMFAACRLRTVCQELAPKLLEKHRGDLFQLLAAYLDPVIARAIDFSNLTVDHGDRPATLALSYRVPAYRSVLSAGPPVDLSDGYKASVEGIFGRDSNTSASKVIRGLGYAWINGVMRFGGFPKIWLAGDYLESQPYARVASVNDRLSAQAMSSREMAAFFGRLFVLGLAGNQDAAQVLVWLRRGGSWLSDNYPEVAMRYPEVKEMPEARVAKQGIGNLKNHATVRSEAAAFRYKPNKKNIQRRFLVVWQNSTPRTAGSFEVMLRTIDAFMAASVSPGAAGP